MPGEFIFNEEGRNRYNQDVQDNPSSIYQQMDRMECRDTLLVHAKHTAVSPPKRDLQYEKLKEIRERRSKCERIKKESLTNTKVAYDN